MPSNNRRFPFPSRPLPGCSVTEQVYRQIDAVFHCHPGQYRRVSLWNKFSVELPTFSIAVSTIALTFGFPRLTSYYRRITAIRVELLRLPSFYRENRRITAFPVDSRHYRRFSISLSISTEVPRYRIRLPSNCRCFTIPSRSLPSSIVPGQV